MRLVGAATGLALAMLPALAFQRELPPAAESLAAEIAANGNHTVAVWPFTNLQGNVTELGRFVAEEMELGLVTSKNRVSVIDRAHIRTLLQEHKLASSGLVDPTMGLDPTAARKLGEITGVDAIVTGTLTPFGDSVRLVVKVMDSQTAKVFVASSVDIAKTKTIEELLSKPVQQPKETDSATVVARVSESERQSTRPLMLRGAIDRFEYVNPRAHLYLTDSTGEKWAVELPSPNELMRQGWSRTWPPAGVTVTITCSESSNGSMQRIAGYQSCRAAMILVAGREFTF